MLIIKFNIRQHKKQGQGTEYLHLAFKPAMVTVNGVKISLHSNNDKEVYTLKYLGNGDYAVKKKRMGAGKVIFTVL